MQTLTLFLNFLCFGNPKYDAGKIDWNTFNEDDVMVINLIIMLIFLLKIIVEKLKSCIISSYLMVCTKILSIYYCELEILTV